MVVINLFVSCAQVSCMTAFISTLVGFLHGQLNTSVDYILRCINVLIIIDLLLIALLILVLLLLFLLLLLIILVVLVQRAHTSHQQPSTISCITVIVCSCHISIIVQDKAMVSMEAL